MPFPSKTCETLSSLHAHSRAQPQQGVPAGFGGGNGVETVEERRSQLETWMNSVLHLCPMDKEILGFLAEDGRCAPQPHTAFSTAC